MRAVAVLERPKFRFPSMSVAWTMSVYWDTFCMGEREREREREGERDRENERKTSCDCYSPCALVALCLLLGLYIPSSRSTTEAAALNHGCLKE